MGDKQYRHPIIMRSFRIRSLLALPKASGGKLPVRANQALCEGRNAADLTTMDDPAALEQLRDILKNLQHLLAPVLWGKLCPQQFLRCLGYALTLCCIDQELGTNLCQWLHDVFAGDQIRYLRDR